MGTMILEVGGHHDSLCGQPWDPCDPGNEAGACVASLFPLMEPPAGRRSHGERWKRPHRCVVGRCELDVGFFKVNGRCVRGHSVPLRTMTSALPPYQFVSIQPAPPVRQI